MPGPVLITGAGGFAGGHLIDLLIHESVPIVAAYGPGREGNIRTLGQPEQALRWVPFDVLDREVVRSVLTDTRPSVVYHLAGMAAVGSSWQHVTKTYEVNVLGTHHLLEALRETGLASTVLVPGSAHVYAPSPTPLDEAAAVRPDSPYALSKLAQELRAVHAADQDGQRVVVTRSFNHLGPRQEPSFVGSSFARQIALIEAGRAEPVLRVGNLDTIRDLTDVRDTVHAYRLLAERGESGRVYNVSSGHGRPVRELLDGLIAQAGVEVRVETDPSRMRPSDRPILVGDNSRLRADTGWETRIPIEQTLRDLLDYWRAVI